MDTQKCAKDITWRAKEESLYLHSYSDTCVVAPKDGVEVKHYCSRTGMEYQVSDDLLKTIGHAPCKLLAIDMENHGRLEAFRNRIQEKYGDKISAIFSNPIYLEIFDKTAGKGNAVRFVCEHFQIPLSNSVAAGDAENDISMLQAAGTAVAMANATPEVKACADFITQQDNDHDGLSEAILQLFEM